MHLLVTAICRLAFPSSITSNTSSGLETNLSVAPYAKMSNYDLNDLLHISDTYFL